MVLTLTGEGVRGIVPFDPWPAGTGVGGISPELSAATSACFTVGADEERGEGDGVVVLGNVSYSSHSYTISHSSSTSSSSGDPNPAVAVEFEDELELEGGGEGDEVLFPEIRDSRASWVELACVPFVLATSSNVQLAVPSTPDPVEFEGEGMIVQFQSRVI